MNIEYIEYEATFLDIDKDRIREKLRKAGAKLVKPEFLQKRNVFNLPGKSRTDKWLRVRDEGNKITMSFKMVDGNNIENQKEISLVIDDFKKGTEFLEAIGCRKKAYQETKREIWKLDNVEICIDEWPFLEPFVEIEGGSEKEVMAVSEKLGFNYSEALFCAVGLIYSKKYNIPVEVIDNKISEIIFNTDNPFLKIKKQK